MTRPLRLRVPGATHHVFARGIDHQSIFRDTSDRRQFLSILARVAMRARLCCDAYCLMGNHYHLVVETEEANLSEAIHDLNGHYAMRFNRRHDRTGHVFEGRFQSRLIDTDSYLLQVVRYVLLNPVRSGVAASAGDWLWSSFRATMGDAPAPSFLAVDRVLGLLSPRATRARELFGVFVDEGDASAAGEEGASGPALGDAAFLRELAPRLAAVAGESEFPRRERFIARPSLRELFAFSATKALRNEAVRAARLRHGYRLRDIADHLGVHYTTVSKICLGSGLEINDIARPDPKREKTAISRPDPECEFQSG